MPSNPHLHEKALLSTFITTAYPKFQSTLPSIVERLISHPSYSPGFIQLSEGGKRLPFNASQLEQITSQSEGKNAPRAWSLERRASPYFSLIVTKGHARFDSIIFLVERDYFTDSQRTNELISLLRSIYEITHPAFASVSIDEMEPSYNNSRMGRKMTLGINLERALPGIFWANFFGPEYVEMFGKAKVDSAPCYSVEALPDSGALLRLSSSPLDYLNDPERFEIRRLEIKNHLGIEAFDTGDVHFQGKVPRFRYLEERGGATVEKVASLEKVARQARRVKTPGESSDWISTVARKDWKKWVETNRSFSEDFIRELEQRGVRLDLSGQSLKKLDEYLATLRKSPDTANMEFLKKLAAFISQTVIQQTGANWSFKESEDVPSLVLGKIHFSPVARAQKVLLEGETFEHWYRFLLDELIPKVKTENSV